MSVEEGVEVGQGLLAMDDIPCAVLVTDAQGHVLRMNRELLRIVGADEAHWRGQSMEKLLTPASRVFAQSHLFPLLHHDAAVNEIHVRLQDAAGAAVPVMVNAACRTWDGVPCIVWSIFVARERSRFEGELIRARADAQTLAQQLQSMEEEQRLLIDSLMAGLVVHAPDGTVLRCNPRARELLGLSSVDEATGRPLSDPAWRFVRPDGGVMSVDEYPVGRVLASGEAISSLLLGVQRPDRSDTVWLLCRADPHRHADGRLRQVVVTFVDVTDRQNAAVRLRQSESRLQGLVESAMDAIISTDSAHRIVIFNAAAETMFGLKSRQVLGQPLTKWIPALLDDGKVLQLDAAGHGARSAHRPEGPGQLYARRADGQPFPIEAAISRVEVDGETLHTVIVRDITSRLETQRALELSHFALEHANAQLTDLAHYDALTGLPNRVLLLDRMQQALTQSQRRGRVTAVAFLDLDGFKAVNDQHGHAAGDLLLRTLAGRLRAALREGDTMARIGGDEFVALLVDLEEAQAVEPVLQRLLAAVAQPFDLEGATACLSTSIGVAFSGTKGGNTELLLGQADQAMYAAKQSGKNCWRYYDARHKPG